MPLWGQAKYERDFRIKKSEFPESAINLLEEEVSGARRMRYYKELDSLTTSFKAKFRKDRLHYSIVFNEQGELEEIELIISQVDIPKDIYEAVSIYIERDCSKFRIRRLLQQYPMSDRMEIRKLIRDAFQNLMLPYINYEILVSCKTGSGREEFDYLFDANGDFISRRKSLPANYDHILY